MTHRVAPVAVLAPEPEVEVCSSGEADRAMQLGQWRDLAATAVSVVEVAGGVRVSVGVGSLQGVARLAAEEQPCCPFYDIHLHLDGPVVHLEVRSTDPTALVLTALRAGARPGVHR